MERIVTKLKEAQTFIQPYIPLIDSHMVSFFTLNHWDVYVPLIIKEEFTKNLDKTNNIVDLFSKAVTSNSNLNFRNLNQFVQSIKRMDIAQEECLSVTKLKQVLEIDHYDFRKPPLKEFMSKKKAHEVEILKEIIASLTHLTGVTHVVDIGDGKGYLSSLLALHYGIKVLGLESSEGIIQGSEKRKLMLYKHWSITNNGKAFGSTLSHSLYRQTHAKVQVNTNIGYYVQHKFPENWPLYILGINGLHTCGDLSTICLHLFLSDKYNPFPRFLINVGCCYHLLNNSEEQNEENPSGFPLSSLMKKSNFHLSKNARMMSLKAPSRLFCLKKSLPASLMYRAVLEQLLDDIFGPGIPVDRDVGRIGLKCQNFIEYVRKASLILNCQIPFDDEGLQTYYKKFEPLEKNLHFYFMLRVIMAPIIEGIILLDRLLFLKEKGIEKSYLVKLFDPVISPRCYGIVAIRDDYHSHNPPPLLH